MFSLEQLPAAGGTYVVVTRVERAVTLVIGQLGTFDFAAGWYAYVGSAQGPGGLRARVGRHLRADKPLRWHIDFLTTAAPTIEVWFADAPDRLECAWAARLAALPDVGRPVPGFGSSDCACASHLFTLPVDALAAARHALGDPRAISASP